LLEAVLALRRVRHHEEPLHADASGARLAERLEHPREPHLVLHDVEDALRAGLDAVGDLPAARAPHEAQRRRVEEVRVAVAAPREAESLGEEALAQLGDPWPVHGEQVVVEEDVAHTEVGEAPAEADDVVDAMEASLTARGGAIAEGARERTAARGDEARE